ncbi:MAG: hypothetical protein HC827_04525 [Cyanobacteria bacterium RM1_2_2]|nr:hypothetical protein [Cyanobacteria bacterium RM1_2_2]
MQTSSQNFNRKNWMLKTQTHRILLCLAIGINVLSILSACTLRSDSSYSTKVSELETAPAAEALSEASNESETLNDSETASPPDEIIEEVKRVLAAKTEISVAEIALKAAIPTEWNNACLGMPNPEEICAQVITPGYRIVLSTATATYTFHTDQTGANLRWVKGIPN